MTSRGTVALTLFFALSAEAAGPALAPHSQGPAARARQAPALAAPIHAVEPMIYLYPKEAQHIRVKVLTPKGIDKSEPEYGDGWEVLAEPDGKLKCLGDNRGYPGLLWEAWLAPMPNPSRLGAVVTQAEVEPFFRKSLERLGLEPTEIDDFLKAWMPKFTRWPYYRIRFLPPEDIDVLAPLVIEPKPDTVIRVFFDVETLGAPELAIPQYVPPRPERRGFTAVEWGGAAFD